MFGKVCGWFQSAVSKGLALGAVAVTLMSVTAVDLLAQEGSSISFTAPQVDFSTVATPLVTALTTAAVSGMGIGLSLWALLMIPRFFRRAAK